MLREDGGRTTLEPTGPLLSTLGGTWTSRTTSLERDDLLLTWSDGLVEGTESDVSDAGLAAVLDDLVRAWSPDRTAGPAAPPARDVVEGLLAALREDAPEWGRDDITLVAVRRTS